MGLSRGRWTRVRAGLMASMGASLSLEVRILGQDHEQQVPGQDGGLLSVK